MARRNFAGPSLLSNVWPSLRTPGSGGFLLVVVDLCELRVDHVLFLAGLAAAGRCTAVAGAAGTGLSLLLGLVHRLAELHRSLRQRVGLGRDRGRVVTLERFLEIGHRILDRLALGLADLRAVLSQGLLSGVQECLGVVLRLDRGLALLVLLGVRLGVLHHLLDVGFAQAARGLDADLLLLAGALVL